MCRHYWIYVALCGAGMVVLALSGAPFDRVLRDDALNYLLKAREITRGDWEPVHTHFIGWPMFLSVFVGALRVDSVFSGMVLSRLISIALTGLLVVPVALVAERVFDRRAGLFAVAATALSSPLVRMGPSSYAEPLFLPLTLLSLYFLIPNDRETDGQAADPPEPAGGRAAFGAYLTPRNVLIAAALGSLTWYVRANGVFLLVVGMGAVAFWTRGRLRWILLAALPAVFVTVSLPHLVPRALRYGSPFDYGENSKLFVDSYQQVFSPNVPVPSAAEYFRTHSFSEIFDKFVTRGLWKQLRALAGMVAPLWMVCAILGALSALVRRHRPSLAVVMCIGVFMAGFTAVFDVFGTARHLLVLLPLLFVLGGGFLSQLFSPRLLALGRLSWLGWAVLAGIALWSLATAPLYRLPRGIDLSEPVVRDEWAHWGAQNLTGIIAIVEGDVLLDLCLPEPLPAARRREHESFALSFERPGYFTSLEDAYADFLARGYAYLFLDSDNIVRRGYLENVYEPGWADRFVLIREFRSLPEDRWEIPDMDVFRIVRSESSSPHQDDAPDDDDDDRKP